VFDETDVHVLRASALGVAAVITAIGALQDIDNEMLHGQRVFFEVR
jgi:hypothetical protein